MYRKMIFVIIMILLFISHVSAQNGISLGLGDAYTAVARGPEAIFWNPANLALTNDLPNFNFKLYSLGFNFGNNVFNIDFYNEYFTGTGQEDEEGNKIGRELTDSDKDDILGRIPESGLELLGRGDFSFFGINYKNFGFSIEANAFLKASFPKDAFRMILTDIGHKTYSFNIDAEGLSTAKANLSYGRTILKNTEEEPSDGDGAVKINELAVGFTISYIKGLAYGEVTESDIKVIIDEQGFNAPSRIVAKSAVLGTGFGIDFGIGAVLNNGWQLGLAFENIPGYIKWSNETKEYIYSFDLKRKIFVDEFSDIEIDDYTDDIENELDGFTQMIPFNVRFGVAKYYKFLLGNFEISRVYENIGISVGGGLELKFLELYAAYTRANNDNYFSSALALNFKYFYLDFGIMNRGGITGNSSKALSFATSLRFGF